MSLRIKCKGIFRALSEAGSCLIHVRLWIIRLALPLFSFVTISSQHPLAAQTISSQNGWELSAHDTIGVFVIFAQVRYDKHPAEDPSPDGGKDWRPNSMPQFANQLFSADPANRDTGIIMTTYYREMSLGNLIVLGDFYPRLITISESELDQLNLYTFKSAVAGKIDSVESNLELPFSFFDRWSGGGGGRAFEKKPDGKFDHVMLVIRNLAQLPSQNGRASRGSIGKIAQHMSNTYSVFGAVDDNVFNIMHHEFDHLLIGANNFHAGGGSAPIYPRTFIPLQCGWSMLGAANATILTCNAWDRWWLGWKNRENKFEISGRNSKNGNEVNADIDPENFTGTRKIVLRDFVSTGDAVRIKLPMPASSSAQQYLWLENHEGRAFNGSPFDKFQYQDEAGFAPLLPGVYAFVQVGNDHRSDNNIYSESRADYIRALPANGFFDIYFEPETTITTPIGFHPSITTRPYQLLPSRSNALTGNMTVEFPPFDKTGDARLSQKDIVALDYQDKPGMRYPFLDYLGNTDMGFRKGENDRIAADANPAPFNMETYLGPNPNFARHQKGSPTRAVRINGISISFAPINNKGEVEVLVANSDTIRLNQDVRWCADTLILKPFIHRSIRLEVASGKTLLIDHGLTPTRTQNPDTINGDFVFASPTIFKVDSGAVLVLDAKSRLHLAGGSSLLIEPGGKVIFGKKARLMLDAGSVFNLRSGAQFKIDHKLKVKKSNGSKIFIESPEERVRFKKESGIL